MLAVVIYKSVSDHLWINDILNVDLHGINHIFYIIYIPLSHLNLTKYGRQIWYFDTSKYGTPSKNWSWHPVPYLEEIRYSNTRI